MIPLICPRSDASVRFSDSATRCAIPPPGGIVEQVIEPLLKLLLRGYRGRTDQIMVLVLFPKGAYPDTHQPITLARGKAVSVGQRLVPRGPEHRERSRPIRTGDQNRKQGRETLIDVDDPPGGVTQTQCARTDIQHREARRGHGKLKAPNPGPL